MPAVIAHRSQRQMDLSEFDDSLFYTDKSGLHGETYLNKTETKQETQVKLINIHFQVLWNNKKWEMEWTLLNKYKHQLQTDIPNKPQSEVLVDSFVKNKSLVKCTTRLPSQR